MNGDVKDYYLYFHRKGGEVTRFMASDEDTSTDVQYFGFMNEEGSWIIMRSDRSNDPVEHRYVGGQQDYATAWANRASLSYDYYNELFPASA